MTKVFIIGTLKQKQQRNLKGYQCVKQILENYNAALNFRRLKGGKIFQSVVKNF